MARGFPEEFRQELLNKTDIVDIISNYVDLKKKGSKYWGCCPFHSEKTASFNVDINKQFFYCFGCSKGGDAITFIKEIEHLGYVESVEYLADKAGLTVPRMADSKEQEEMDRRKKRHYEISRAAAAYFFGALTKPGNRAMEYCIGRKISPSIIKRFGIGYSPPDRDGLYKHLIVNGFTKEEAIASGLVKESQSGATYDFFSDRLMFPIMDVYGNVIAFGGRILNEGQPKYLNSFDSPLYNKKRHLYGLSIAKKNKQTDKLILVEGYMDVVALSSFGVAGAVASLGTSLTKEQCMLIKRFTKDVIIAYDGDAAGKKAAVRAGKLLLVEGIVPRILVISGGKDPDEFLKKFGVEKFEELMEKAVLPYRFEIDLLSENYDLSTDVGRRDYGAAAAQIVSSIKNELDKEDILKYLSVKTGYSVDALDKQSVKLHKLEKNSYNNTQMAAVPQKDDKRLKAEALAIKLAVCGYKDEILIGLCESDFMEPVFRQCYSALKTGANTESDLMGLFREEGQSTVMKIAIIDDDAFKASSVSDCIIAIKSENAKIELDRLKGLLGSEITKDERLEVLTKISELQKILKQN